MLAILIPPLARLGRLPGLGPFLARAANSVVLGDLTSELLTHLVTPIIHPMELVTIVLGAFATVHSVAAHHQEESAALLLVKPVTLTLGALALLEVLSNAASLVSGGGLGF